MFKDISPSDRSVKDFKTYKQFTFTNTDSGSGVFGLQGTSGSFHNFLTVLPHPKVLVFIVNYLRV